MWIRSDSRDVNLASIHMDEEEDVLRDQAKAGPHFRGKEIGSYRRTVGTSIWLRMNSLQVVSLFRPQTGGNPCFRRTFPTVVSLTRCPRFFRALEIRSYPRLLFALANLRMSVTTSADTAVWIQAVVQEIADSCSRRTSGPPV